MRLLLLVLFSLTVSFNANASNVLYPEHYIVKCGLKWTALGADPSKVPYIDTEEVEGSDSADTGEFNMQPDSLPTVAVKDLNDKFLTTFSSKRVVMFAKSAPSWTFEITATIDWNSGVYNDNPNVSGYSFPNTKIEYKVYRGKTSTEPVASGTLADDNAFGDGSDVQHNGAIDYIVLNGEFRGTWNTGTKAQGGRQGVFNCALDSFSSN